MKKKFFKKAPLWRELYFWLWIWDKKSQPLVSSMFCDGIKFWNTQNKKFFQVEKKVKLKKIYMTKKGKKEGLQLDNEKEEEEKIRLNKKESEHLLI